MLNLQMTHTLMGIATMAIFVLAYILVMTEEVTQLRKSKPAILAAGLIWIIVAMAAKSKGLSEQATIAIKHNILDYAELFLFLFVAMTYVNTIEERNVFEALRGWLVRKQFSYRSLFWITGILAFFISPIADNMTTALLMCAVVMAVGINQPRFIAISCINIVVAANAGGAFCPFGDITTLMVWQKGVLPFATFFKLFVPSIANYLIPACIMHFAIPKEKPAPLDSKIEIHPGGLVIVFLFLLTIATAVFFHHTFELPPVVGMMTGLGYLQIFGYYLKKRNHSSIPYDIFQKMHRVEWDTLLFFYGIILCVGGLAAFGYLEIISSSLYEQWGAQLGTDWGGKIHQQTPANITIGMLSAIVDNIPLMFAVLTMNPVMSEGQWLLITLTAGVGGSLLSIGSAAGVALMGQSKGQYTFLSHLKWSWAILLGYIASIAVHFWINKPLFEVFHSHV